MPTLRVINSSLLITADRQGVLVALERFLCSGPPAVAPPKVYGEIVSEPRCVGFDQSAARIEGLFGSWSVEIRATNYTDSHVSAVVGRVRVSIARRS